MSYQESSVSFSRLLLVAASSKKYIAGEGNDKIIVSPKITIAAREPFEGEVVLCFQLDDRRDKDKRVARSLGLQDEAQRCDGLIFYSQDGEDRKTICLVEMKSTNIAHAPGQLIETKRHVENLLREECRALPETSRADCQKQITHIQWKAGVFHHGSSPKIESVLEELKTNGFSDVRAFTSADNDVRKLLIGESAKDMSKKYKHRGQR